MKFYTGVEGAAEKTNAVERAQDEALHCGAEGAAEKYCYWPGQVK